MSSLKVTYKKDMSVAPFLSITSNTITIDINELENTVIFSGTDDWISTVNKIREIVKSQVYFEVI